MRNTQPTRAYVITFIHQCPLKTVTDSHVAKIPGQEPGCIKLMVHLQVISAVCSAQVVSVSVHQSDLRVYMYVTHGHEAGWPPRPPCRSRCARDYQSTASPAFSPPTSRAPENIMGSYVGLSLGNPPSHLVTYNLDTILLEILRYNTSKCCRGYSYFVGFLHITSNMKKVNNIPYIDCTSVLFPHSGYL